MQGRRRTYRAAWLALPLALATIVAMTFGMAQGSPGPPPDPCTNGGTACDGIGITDGWYEGSTVDFQYTHRFFCAEPPGSAAGTHCEAGADAQHEPPSGTVGAEVYALVPVGFSPPAGTLQCPVPGRCIDHPNRIDLSRVAGFAGSSNALFPPHSFVIDDDEEFNGVWWPVEIVFVNTMSAWNAIASAKTLDAVRAQQTAGHASDDIGTNVLLWFEVLNGEEGG